MPSISKSVNFFWFVHVFFFLLSLLLQHWVHFVNFYNIIILSITDLSLCTNPLARSPGQVKLDSDMWKLWKNLFELVENLSKFGFRASRWKTLRQRLWWVFIMNHNFGCIVYLQWCALSGFIQTHLGHLNTTWPARSPIRKICSLVAFPFGTDP